MWFWTGKTLSKIFRKFLIHLKSKLNKGSSTYVGTPNYMAPEIYNQRELTEKIDVFAFGTMLFEIFAR